MTSSGCGSSSTTCATATPRWVSSTPVGVRCRDGSRTTSRCRSTTCTSRCTPPSSGPRASLSNCRSAPSRCTGPRSSVSPRTGATRTAPSATRAARTTSPGCGNYSSGSVRPRTPTSSWTHCGMTSTPPKCSSSPRRATSSRCPPGPLQSTSPTPCTPRSDIVVWERASTVASSRWNPSCPTATPSRSSQARMRTAAPARTGCSSSRAPAPGPRSRPGSPRSAARRPSSGARTASTRRSASADCRSRNCSAPSRSAVWPPTCGSPT